MCACVPACLYACYTFMRATVHICKRIMYVYVRACMHICMHECLHSMDACMPATFACDADMSINDTLIYVKNACVQNVCDACVHAYKHDNGARLYVCDNRIHECLDACMRWM